MLDRVVALVSGLATERSVQAGLERIVEAMLSLETVIAGTITPAPALKGIATPVHAGAPVGMDGEARNRFTVSITRDDSEFASCVLVSTVPELPAGEQDTLNAIATTSGVLLSTLVERTKIHEKDRFHRMILDQIADMVTVTDMNGNITWTNAAESRVLGYPEGALVGKSVSVYGDDPHRGATQQVIIDAVRATGSWRGEVVNKDVHGNEVSLDARVRVFHDENGKPEGMIGISTDITAHKHAEHALKENEERFRLVMEATNDGIWDWNFQTGHAFFSDRYYTMLGYEPGEFEGNYESWRSLVHPDDLTLAERTIQDHLANKLPGFDVEFRLRMKDGSWKWVHGRGKVVTRDEQGMPVRLVGTHVDITDRVLARRLLEAENTRLKEIDDMRKEFVALATHELKTPLVSVYGASGFLIQYFENAVSTEAMNMIKAIHRGATRLKGLVENLLDFSRVDRGRLDMDVGPVALQDVLDSALKDLEYMQSQRLCKITSCVDGIDGLLVNGDQLRLEQVFVNLLSNAMKNSPRGCSIEVGAAAGPDKTSIHAWVKDGGVGITADEMDNLFTVFGRIPREGLSLDVDIQGTGLGLFITREIIERHGGRIWVESAGRDKGSTFHVELPADLVPRT